MLRRRGGFLLSAFSFGAARPAIQGKSARKVCSSTAGVFFSRLHLMPSAR
jgi:hypothetical protein